MEGYYQETGRAGRDGLASNCVLFFGVGDIAKQNFFIDQIADEQEQEKSRKNLNTLVQFATIHSCRRKQILNYFGEEAKDSCGNCDICNDVTKAVEATVDAQKILSGIIRSDQSFGINHIIDIVWGADTEKIRARNHQELKTFGVGKDKSKKWWRGIINELIGQQVIFQDSNRYNILKLTSKAEDILYNREQFFISETTSVNDKAVHSRDELLDNSGPVDQKLLSLLKEKRTEIARQKHVPPYIVFNDKTLKDMALIKPTDMEQFLMVSGVGEKKMEEYSPYFLPIIKEYLSN